MSEILPTLILEPKPPAPLGHRNASTPAPKPDRPRANEMTIDRLKNWRRVTPSVSSSGGTQATGGSATLTGAADSRRASTAARSTSRPVTDRPSSDSSTGPRSRRVVSLLITPSAEPVSRRRAEANSRTPASITRTGTAMAMIVVGLIGRPSGPRRRAHRRSAATRTLCSWFARCARSLGPPDHSSKNRPTSQGNTKFCPGPRKNEPMSTSTAHDMRKIVKSEMANLRSSGLFDGLRSV